jgi:hypothetical protein
VDLDRLAALAEQDQLDDEAAEVLRLVELAEAVPELIKRVRRAETLLNESRRGAAGLSATLYPSDWKERQGS